MNRLILALVSALAAVLMIGLASCAARPVPRDRAPILHVVLVKLKQPGDAQRAYDDVVSVLNNTRAARDFIRGFHVDTGRPEVDADYDMALIMEFETRALYEKYLTSEAHGALLRVWRPHIAGLRIFDISKEPTANPNVIMKNPGVLGPQHSPAPRPTVGRR